MQEQNIANILLYDMMPKQKPAGLDIDNLIISEIVEGWNKNIYVIPKRSLKFQKCQHKKYDFM